MLGKEIWLNDEKIKVTGYFNQPGSGIKITIVCNKPEGRKKITVAPFKFTVGTKENQKLTSWYTYGLQQYSGFLEYETSITIDDTSSNVFIDLGEVKYMAEVFVNDQPVGAVYGLLSNLTFLTH